MLCMLTDNSDNLFDKCSVYHTFTPYPNAPVRCAPLVSPVSIILLKVPPRSKIVPPRLINEKVVYRGHKETLSTVIFVKNGGPYSNRVFPAWC